MRKGQSSLEIVLIAVIILFAGITSFVVYNKQGVLTVAEVTLRSNVDTVLARAAFDNPECSLAQLRRIEVSEGNKKLTYTIKTSITECNPIIFDADTLQDLEGKISLALGCNYETFGVCKSYTFEVDTFIEGA